MNKKLPLIIITILSIALIIIVINIPILESLSPAATYSIITKFNGYEIKSRTSCCSNNQYITQYYINPPGFRDCLNIGCRFSSVQEAKDYIMSLAPVSIPIKIQNITTYNINIWSDQEANAFINNIYIGKSSPQNWITSQYSPGEYTINIQKFGFNTYSEKITLNSDKSIIAYLTPAILSPTPTPTPSPTPQTPSFSLILTLISLFLIRKYAL